MVWSCASCTFENHNDQDNRCEICELERGHSLGMVASSKRPFSSSNVDRLANEALPKRAVQSTLFGGQAVIEQPSRKKMKRKAPKAAKDPSFPQVNSVNSKSNITSSIATSSHDESSIRKEKRPHENTHLPAANFTTAHTKADPPSEKSFAELKARARDVLRDVFRLERLRNLQPAAIKCALKRQSQIVVMATGGGKSLCYQLSAICLGGTTLVISPLIALMVDQVSSLCSKGIEAAIICSAHGERRNLDIMERLVGRRLRATKTTSTNVALQPTPVRKPVVLCYVTPEQIQTDRFRNILVEMNQQGRLTMFAVDEAHCLSSWGHDFRPAYRKLTWLRETFPEIPCMACTATATPKVITDIQDVLKLADSPCHVGSFDRENIRYEVRYKDSLDATHPLGCRGDLAQFITAEHKACDKEGAPCSGIIYVHKRDDTMQLAAYITKETGISTVAYHGGLKDNDRSQAQMAWQGGQAKIAIATVAFGMGIDLPHVRYVVHWSLAKTVEGFYQESGRAGRDGRRSRSVLYYSREDASRFEFLINQRPTKAGDQSKTLSLDGLRKMMDYCTTTGCRRLFLLRHFGQQVENAELVCRKNCDYCADPDMVSRAISRAKVDNGMSFHVGQVFGVTSTQLEDPDDDHYYSVSDWHGKEITTDGLRIIAPSGSEDVTDDVVQKPARKAKSAEIISSILSKYEAMECKLTEGKGFVRFKEKEKPKPGLRRDPVLIPAHLASAFLSSATSCSSQGTSQPTYSKSSADYDAEAARLRQEIDERHAKMNELRAKIQNK